MTVKKIWKCGDVEIVFRQVRRTLPGIKFLVLVEEGVAAGDRNIYKLAQKKCRRMTEQVYKYNSLLTYPSNAPKILMIEIFDFFIFKRYHHPKRSFLPKPPIKSAPHKLLEEKARFNYKK